MLLRQLNLLFVSEAPQAALSVTFMKLYINKSNAYFMTLCSVTRMIELPSATLKKGWTFLSGIVILFLFLTLLFLGFFGSQPIQTAFQSCSFSSVAPLSSVQEFMAAEA